MRRAKIIATLGPASRERLVLTDLIRAGVNVVRINMSHEEQATGTDLIHLAREVAKELSQPLSILVDLAGPKLRTGQLVNHQPVAIETGQQLTITSRELLGDGTVVSTNYPELVKSVKEGTRILIDDGAITLKVLSLHDQDVVCEVTSGGILNEHKGINVPGVNLPIPALTTKDRHDLEWAVKLGADYLALSFVRQAVDCQEAIDLIRQAGGGAELIAKIEMVEAMTHLPEIIAAADGVMVARGDLGVETSVELVPIYQKQIIEQANRAGKLVITATQMLQSMMTKPQPTRAEASDVANAIWDGSDALLLSNETAVGQYPVPTVRTMARIIEQAEQNDPFPEERSRVRLPDKTGDFRFSLCQAATHAASEIGAKLIVVFTESGAMARALAAFRPRQRIVAFTQNGAVQNALAATWGVESLVHRPAHTTVDLIQMAEKILLANHLAVPGEALVLMAGRLSGLGLSSSIKIQTIGESTHEENDAIVDSSKTTAYNRSES